MTVINKANTVLGSDDKMNNIIRETGKQIQNW